MVKRYGDAEYGTTTKTDWQKLALELGKKNESLQRERDALRDYILNIVSVCGRDFPDSIDNDGQPYQSAGLDKLISELLAKGAPQ